MSAIVKNLVMFKIGWVACVLSAASGAPWIGALTVAAVVAEHLRTTPAPAREAGLLGIAALVGLFWESVLVSAGLVEYPAASIAPGLAPYWIVAMWVLFATTLNVGLKWLRRHWLVAAVAGGLSGPMAFFGGERAGAVIFSAGSTSLLAIGIGWAVLLPLMTQLSRRYDGHRSDHAGALAGEA